MGSVVALGDPMHVRGFALAGATVIEAADEEAAADAWSGVPADTALLILSAGLERVLLDRLRERPRLLVAVLPG